MHRKPHPYRRGELLVVIDCADLDRSAEFWSEVLGYVREAEAFGTYLATAGRRGLGALTCACRVGTPGVWKSSSRGSPKTRGTNPACTSTCARPTWSPRSSACWASVRYRSPNSRSRSSDGAGTCWPT